MKTKSELANMLGISRPTLNKRLKEIGFYFQGYHLYTPKEVDKIFEIWGRPTSSNT